MALVRYLPSEFFDMLHAVSNLPVEMYLQTYQTFHYETSIRHRVLMKAITPVQEVGVVSESLHLRRHTPQSHEFEPHRREQHSIGHD